MTSNTTDARYVWSHWLKRLRADLDLTQDQLAERVGCSIETISAFELGRRRPSRFMAERLAQVLQIAPQAQVEFIRQARSGGERPAKSTPAQQPDPAPRQPVHRLPVPPTPLIGREQEAADLRKRLLDPACRLVTLVGPGGIGKSRLAIQVAHELHSQFADGAAFVALADVAQAEDVAAAIVDGLECPAQGDQPPQERLLGWLRERELLLVLDNLEHLLAATPLLQAILREAPGVRLLVTSRERLRLQAEWVVELAGLAVPARDDHDTIAHADAAVLFVERATRATGSFVLGPSNQAAVAAICRRLEGLPLAIELAAARTKHLSPQALLERLNGALAILGGGAHDLPERHRTMHATLQWSYDLLAPLEQELFRRLAVFHGGWTLEAAEAVGQSGDGDVLDLLANLVDKSLVRAETDSERMRYRMLEPVRQYAEELLQASDELEMIRQRHAEQILASIEEAEAGLRSPEQGVWLQRLDHELPNLRAALQWLIGQGNADAALTVSGQLWFYWSTRGSLREGRSWLTQALGLPTNNHRLRASMLHSAAYLAALQGDVSSAMAHAAEGLQLYTSLGDQQGAGRLMYVRGWVLQQHGQLAEAEAAGKESLEVLQQVGDREGTAEACRFLAGLAQSRGEYAEAAAYLEISLGVWHELQNTSWVATTNAYLAELAAHQGQYRWSEQLLEESLKIFQSLGMERNVAVVRTGLGLVALEQGQNARAALLLSRQAPLLAGEGGMTELGPCLLGLAVVAAERGLAELAARLQGKADQQMTQGRKLEARDQRLIERANSSRHLISTTAWETALAAGRSLTLEQVTELALEVPLDEVSSSPTPAIGEALTPREVEVLRLLAQGASNQAIAETLVISIHTVKVHVTRLLAKLEVTSRTEAALRAHSLGITSS